MIPYARRCTSWPAKRWGSDSGYFAYGSNLDIDQKELRTGTIRHAEACRLPGYRFLFNKRGSNGQCFANIVPDRSADVWGVAHLCSPVAMREMDRFEGVAGRHYFRVFVRLLTRTGEARDLLPTSLALNTSVRKLHRQKRTSKKF